MKPRGKYVGRWQAPNGEIFTCTIEEPVRRIGRYTVLRERPGKLPYSLVMSSRYLSHYLRHAIRLADA